MNLLNDRGIEVTNSGENGFRLIMTDATTIQNLGVKPGNMGDGVNGSNVLEGKGKGVGGMASKLRKM